MMESEDHTKFFHVDELRLILDYYFEHPPPWAQHDSPPSVKKKKMSDKDVKVAEEVLQLLNLAAEHFRDLWNWSEFADQFLNHHDSYVVWLACQCMAIVLQLTEADKSLLVNRFMDSKTNLEHNLSYNLKFKFNDKKHLQSYITQEYVTIEEISLPLVGSPKKNNELILVNSTKKNLRNLSLAVSAGKVVCLVGPVGSGKSVLIHYLANITGHNDGKLLTVQLGDETDSKMMLGSYHCTDIPGEFVWQPGVLTKAVTEGLWLLLEDIDSASSDLAAVLVSLIESRSLTVPGFRDRIVPTTGFQLFFTQRILTTASGYHQKHNIATDLLGKHYVQVNVEPLSKNELIEVVEIKFPVLKSVAAKIIDVFLLFSAGFHDSDDSVKIRSIGRLTSTRDLMKWCARAINNYNVTSSESALKVIQDAIDIFCCSAVDSKTRIELACHVASLIGVIKTKAQYILNEYKPTVVLDEKFCIAGRVTLPRSGSFLTDNSTSHFKFALTRSSSCLLERVACCITAQESVLLVGETGTGKTSTLQLLAKHTGNKLIVLNMNQQSDSVDLIGGYKPVELKFIIKPIREQFENLFRAEFDIEQNTKFLGHISTCFNNHEWHSLIKLMKHVIQKAIKKNTKNGKPVERWLELNEKILRFETQLKHCHTAMAFAYVEGSLIRAVREGYWVLLDEINLASAETLQCLSSLLESDGTITVNERTDTRPITRHDNFRLMAAMNPATDVGKKDLPPGIRNRFTEFFVDELTERSDLITMTACYLPDYPAQKLNALSKFYLLAKREAEKSLVDGTGHKPHYSLRTYCRALAIASSNPCQSAPRSLYESFCLSFLTQLDSASHKLVESLIATTIFGEKLIQGVINQPISKPVNGSYVQFEGYWIHKGDSKPLVAKNYILTESVKKNLRDLVRAVSLSCYPVLIQGDTCVGKTSLITYLAAASGNVLVRINNHEHTDLQEYIGSYSAQSVTGQLIFKEGVLVEAMRKGHWIVLDELNLAPTDVLEALNRVLDDNRELFIPETQTLVKAHPGFRLFATQNPPGLYGGRKILSRAFKNRFIEMHFDEIPASELETILYKRCEMPPSYAKKVVLVMKDLQSTRKGSAAFAGKHGFITLRDLFRWGERYRLANAPDNYNWNQHLVDEGFLVLASKVRKTEEEEIIIQILEKHFKCSLLLDRLFTLTDKSSYVTRHILEKIQRPPVGFEQIFMSKNIRRMVVLCCKAIEFNEPILLVGETGCGKTTVCQMIAAISCKKLSTVNCHQHTESSDFLGGLRPVRSKDNENDHRLFEWVDGPLIKAMVDGHMFLADEISLADDSVLERFNSLLEPERKLLLSEKLGDNNSDSELVAHTGFCFVGTMNPGGDYGKKELSPALRNRLTEIWCENCSDNADLIQIVNGNFLTFHSASLYLSESMVRFVNWLKDTDYIRNYLKLNISIRDYLIWVQFIESMMGQLPTNNPYYNTLKAFRTFYKEGAIMIFLDKKTCLEPSYDEAIDSALQESLKEKNQQLEIKEDLFDNLLQFFPSKCTPKLFGCDGYYIPKGNLPEVSIPEFSFETPITKQNVIRLLRCMQISNRAILLEGSPGVGKTSLVQAIAKASGHKLIRINLSEQTDVSDLFGADLPTDGGDGGSFEWRDGPFLRALKEGSWILLDELNLASQSVLEGLNAVLDHRGELYIPELGRTFLIKSNETRLFACQNPMNEGGARKGLPKSFLNRFLQVHLNVLDSSNIVNIIQKLNISNEKKVQSLNLDQVVNFTLSFSQKYNMDLNLRDILRWVEVTIKLDCNILDHLSLIYTNRMPSLKCQEEEIFNRMKILLNVDCEKYDYIRVLPSAVLFNRFAVLRKRTLGTPVDRSNQNLILRSHIHTLNSLAVCVKMKWMPILVGSSCGKTSVIKTLAQLCGQELRVLSVNSSMDTIEILGGFEQADYNRHLEEIAKRVEYAIYNKVSLQLLKGQSDILMLALWYEFKRMSDVQNNTGTTMASETFLFQKRISALAKITSLLEYYDYSKQLQLLADRVTSSGSLNAGGKFEWIDSLLVKCLKDGSWLLIDNVNLCSPAVLDRLNGLLEPNGCLVLGEKGIGSDGEITTIRPHENFRLFLAMDPKHGTISRAMKNRGVEIYMHPLEELNEHDIHSLIKLQGVDSYSIRSTIIKIHQFIKKLASGVVIGINHLLRTAYLISQNSKRNLPILEIVRETCTDVYVRCLIGNLKQNAILEIDRILEEHSEVVSDVWYPNLKTLDVLQSANLCYVNQLCDVLKHYKNLSDTSIEDLLLCYFGRSSSADISTRCKWLLMNFNFESDVILNFVKQVEFLQFDNLTYLPKKVGDNIDWNNLPYDCRYLPAVYYNGINANMPCAENKMHLMLEHTLNKAVDESSAALKKNKKRAMIQNGGMLHDYAVLSVAFDEFVDFFISECSLLIDENNYRSFKEIICWTRSIEQYIYTNLENRGEFLTVLVYCYFSVIVNYFVPLMESITIGVKHTYLERLKTMRDEVRKNYLTPKRHTELMKCYKQQIPSHQCCKTHGDEIVKRHKKNKDYISIIKSNNLKGLISKEAKNQRHEIILMAHSNCETVQSTTTQSIKLENIEINDIELNVIPLWELIIERSFLTNLNHFFDDNDENNSNNDMKFFNSLLQYLPTVSPLYCHSLKNSQRSIDFLLEALKHSFNSVAVNYPNNFLEWLPNNNEFRIDDEETTIEEVCKPEETYYSFEQPLFSVFIIKMLLKEKEPYFTFAPIPIQSIQHTNYNLKSVKHFIQNNSKWTTEIHFKNLKILLKLAELFFSPLLPIDDITSMEELYLSRDNDKCHKSLCYKVNYHDTMVTAVYEAANEIDYIKKNVHLSATSDVDNNLSRQLLFSAGRLWVLSGMYLLEVFSALSPVDPLQKLKVKIECSVSEKIMLNGRLNAEKIFSEMEGVSELFPFKEYYVQRLKALSEKNTNVGYRPEPPIYNAILEEVTRFTKMYGLDGNTYKIINSDLKNRESLVNEIDNWLTSVSSFHDRLYEHYAAYPDILAGILLSINQMRYGMRILRNHFKWSVMKEEHVAHNEEKLLQLFGEFPRFCPDIMEMVDIDETVSMNTNDKFRWYKLCLEELNNMFYLSGQPCGSDQHMTAIRSVVEKFVCNWKRLQEEEESKKIEQESLYKQKSDSETITEETEIAQGVAQQFPTTKHTDFNDIEGPNTLENTTVGDNISQELYSLTDKDINDICRLHDQLVRPAALAHWLSPSSKIVDQNEAFSRIRNTFSDRFCMFGKLLLSKFMYLDCSMDSKMIPWMLLATDIASNPKQRLDKDYYDFYRDSNVEYALKTYEVLKEIEDKIKGLLEEWPDHPTLQTIIKVLKRMMGFDWSSPTCRFLVGLELLLTKLHEWEEVAHRGISMNELVLKISYSIQEYRNLELSTWKDCLQYSLKKVQNDSSKWWFYLYSIFQAYINKQDSFPQLVSALQKFMESSTLGEYSTRLELLYTFHCDTINREKSNEQTELSNASWNLYKYYCQFEKRIHTRIETLTAEVKKKLRDFVKIVKWNDINYWSIKETVTKVQQTLHKYTREYEEILKNSASFAMMTQSTTSETKVDPYILPTFNIDNYLNDCEINLDILDGTDILLNLSKYSKKLNTFSRKTMTNCFYPNHITELNEFINGILESAEELRVLQINLEAPKDKQKSQAKQILQQKRKALSELFKALKRIGLSFKAGLMGCEQINNAIDFARLPPVDLKAALDSLSLTPADDDLHCAWSESESYFLKSVSQIAALKVASEKPKLGQQDMDRVKGFTNDLMKTTWKTKKILASHVDSLVQFRSLLHLSDIITDSDSVVFNPTEDLKSPINYVVNSINILQQFKVTLQCRDETTNLTTADKQTSLFNLLYSENNKNSVLNNSKLPDDISNLNEVIELAQNTLKGLADEKTVRAMKLCDVNFMSNDLYNKAVKICDLISEYINKFYNKIWMVEDHFGKIQFQHELFDSNASIPLEQSSSSKEAVSQLINSILLSVEKLYKKYNNINVLENNESMLLKCQILQPLLTDLEDCNLSQINKKLRNVLKMSVGDNVLRSCLPLLKQYALLVQYFIAQQTMTYRVLSKMSFTLSSLFTDLAANGFCVPDELLEGEDGTQSDGKSGMGLTEGEGAKDVSDQIESQDQLEDAKKNYDNEPEPDKDLKEEEKGVEMSDDFDGKLHDLEKEENENSNDDDDDDNDDDDNENKEMGETGEGAETLDEKLWGSDSEDDENGDEQENEELKEDDGQGGESQGDKQIGAKNDNENGKGEDNEKEEINQKDSKNDINELNDDGDEAGEDHSDPHHGDLEPPPEPEPMDLPNDLQLDEGEMNDNDEGEENPFDIDAMKENMENAATDDELNEEPKKDKNDMEDTSDEEENENQIDDTKIGDNDEGVEEKNSPDDDMNNDGGKKDDNKTGEEPQKEEKEELKNNQENAKPSDDEPSKVEAQSSNLENGGSKDQICENADGQDDSGANEENKEEAIGPEQQGIGRSQKESRDTKQGHSADQDNGASSEEPGLKEKKRRMKPGQKDTNRTLAESNGPMKKRLKTADIQEEDEAEDDDMDESGANKIENANKKGDLFKHVKESKKDDVETLDAAMNEQLENRPIPNNEDEVGEELKDNDIEMEEDIEKEEPKQGDELLPEKVKPKKKNNQPIMNETDGFEHKEINDDEEQIDIEGDVVLTHGVERGMETMFHTAEIKDDEEIFEIEVKDHKEFLQDQYNKWMEAGSNDVNIDEAWNKCMEATSGLAQELSEQLRLVLEPSKASRLQGDFRTGRRINMRRVIPYIASQFRKDKIWLRRTRPSKRQYQIIMAVDNSSSMMDSHAKVLAFESLALVSKALTLVEAGELGVMSFGEQARIVHPLGEPFADQTGARLVCDFTFDEQKTKVGEMIELATASFKDRGRLDNGDQPAQLLVIMSDGRGIKSEGPDVVRNAIRTAKLNGIIIVFIVIDNPTTKESILDVKMPIFENNSVRIESYMDNFPFPFYVILRDVDKLPSVLSDALREWFELVTT